MRGWCQGEEGDDVIGLVRTLMPAVAVSAMMGTFARPGGERGEGTGERGWKGDVREGERGCGKERVGEKGCAMKIHVRMHV